MTKRKINFTKQEDEIILGAITNNPDKPHRDCFKIAQAAIKRILLRERNLQSIHNRYYRYLSKFPKEQQQNMPKITTIYPSNVDKLFNTITTSEEKIIKDNGTSYNDLIIKIFNKLYPQEQVDLVAKLIDKI